MTDSEYELKQLKNQLFHISEQLGELYDSYNSLQALIIDGEAVHCASVLNILNYRFRDNLKVFEQLYAERIAHGSFLRLVPTKM